MPSDYRAIHREHGRRYGTGVREYGDKLLPHRYGDRTHFIYELLQNAEDALARRSGWTGPRSVHFHISPVELRVRHFGLPFDEADVRSICGIGESTKDPGLTEIGRFGIGFKSVYAFTDRPEVHSGEEHFAIEHYVLPAQAPELVPRAAEETVFVLPLRSPADAVEIRGAVRRLAPRALLFLREIEEIEWRVEDGASGLYLRETDSAGDGVRLVKLVGEAAGHRETEQTWLVFARALPGLPGGAERHVEAAFRLGDEGRPEPVPELDTPLFAFFPTTLPTGLRFRIQGPFRTTLARDNVPLGDPWNEASSRRLPNSSPERSAGCAIATCSTRWRSGVCRSAATGSRTGRSSRRSGRRLRGRSAMSRSCRVRAAVSSRGVERGSRVPAGSATSWGRSSLPRCSGTAAAPSGSPKTCRRDGPTS